MADRVGGAAVGGRSPLPTGVWKIAIAASFGPLIGQLDATLVNVALSAIARDLTATIADVQWIVSGYMLAQILVLPLNAWLVDRYGARRLYLASFVGFTAASMLCGAAGTLGWLIVTRLLQGAMGGLLAPMAQLMIARAAGGKMARMAGIMALPVLIAPIIGPSVAAAVLRFADWPWLFYINLPVGLLAIAVAAWLLPDDSHSIRRRPFDTRGFLLIAPALGLILYGIDRVSRGPDWLPLATGASLLGLFVAYAARRGPAALIDVSLFRNRTVSIASATQFLSYGGAYAGQLLLPLFLMNGCRLSPERAGALLAAQGFGMLALYPLVGTLVGRFGFRAVSTGGALVVALGTGSFYMMTRTGLNPSIFAIVLAIRGAGQSAVGMPAMAAAYGSLPKSEVPLATTAMNLIQRIGGPLLVTTMSIVIAHSAGDGTAGPPVYGAAFLALMAINVLAVVLAFRLPRSEARLIDDNPEAMIEG